MTQPFGEESKIHSYGTGGGFGIGGAIGGAYGIPISTSVFTARRPKDPPTIQVVKLTRANYGQVVQDMISNSDTTLHIPEGRKVLGLPGINFLLGDWIVREVDRGVAGYRRPDPDEVKIYGLVDGNA